MQINIAGKGRPLDAICLGRAGMDLYAGQDNVDFAELSTFRKSVGGSPANIAVGMARLGASVGIISKLSEDPVGRFVESFLTKEKVNTEGVSFDASGTRTSLALTEMKPDDCSVVIYRNNAADLLLSEADIDADYIGRARMLIVSGTALCLEPSRSAALRAIDIAAAADVHVVIDLDYRAYTWASLDEAADVYRRASAKASMLFGNLEEFEVLCMQDGKNTVGNSPDAIASYCINAGNGAVFVKGGSAGSTAFISDSAELKSCQQSAFSVQARKPFGAGDAYAAAICTALCRGQSVEEALQRGSAAAAIVVAGDCCCESAPDEAELNTFIKQFS